MTIGTIAKASGLDSETPYKGNSLVLQPEEGGSYWQPSPADGYATVKISPQNCCSNFISMGIQAIAENCNIREHWHAEHEEILFCFEGEGEALVDGVLHRFVPGTTVFVGRWVRHKFTNTGRGYLKLTWTYLPPGLHAIMASIGRPRKPGEAAPTPFPPPPAHAVTAVTGFDPKTGE